MSRKRAPVRPRKTTRPIAIASMTLADNREDSIGRALASVAPWVAKCLVIDTGITDATLERAREAVGNKLVVRPFDWTGSFSDARNFMLRAAADIADWGVMIDTDEWMVADGEDVTRALEQAGGATLFLVTDGTGTYTRERIFRLPTSAEFVGPTHEACIGGVRAVMPGMRCYEQPKSPEEIRRKFVRDADALEAFTREHGDEPRWWYYLGDARMHLGETQAAIVAFEKCASLRGWDEESAWACYRAAEAYCEGKKWREAIDACALGLARHPGIAELAWLAGFAAWQSGHAGHAVWWSRLSEAMGAFRGHAAQTGRIGFRNLMALHEGPYDILRFALRAQGDLEGAAEAERLYQEARAKRLGS